MHRQLLDLQLKLAGSGRLSYSFGNLGGPPLLHTPLLRSWAILDRDKQGPVQVQICIPLPPTALDLFSSQFPTSVQQLQNALLYFPNTTNTFRWFSACLGFSDTKSIKLRCQGISPCTSKVVSGRRSSSQWYNPFRNCSQAEPV